MGYAPTLHQLREMSDDELVETYDAHTRNVAVGVEFYMQEIRTREAARQTRRMLHLTWWIAGFTFVVTVATIINLLLMARGG